MKQSMRMEPHRAQVNQTKVKVKLKVKIIPSKARTRDRIKLKRRPNQLRKKSQPDP